MKTTAILVRHGESLANAGGATSDHTTIPLTELGWQQARDFAASFTGTPTLFAVSPFLRARQTAGPMLERFPHVPVEQWPIEEYTYLDPARCANTTRMEREPTVIAFWKRADPAYRDGVSVETFTEFLDRARETIRRLQAMPAGGCAVLFTHHFFMQALRLYLLFPEATDAELMVKTRIFHDTFPVGNAEAIELENLDSDIRLVGQQQIVQFILEEADPQRIPEERP